MKHEPNSKARRRKDKARRQYEEDATRVRAEQRVAQEKAQRRKQAFGDHLNLRKAKEKNDEN